jgi:hypothetical protein
VCSRKPLLGSGLFRPVAHDRDCVATTDISPTPWHRDHHVQSLDENGAPAAPIQLFSSKYGVLPILRPSVEGLALGYLSHRTSWGQSAIPTTPTRVMQGCLCSCGTHTLLNVLGNPDRGRTSRPLVAKAPPPIHSRQSHGKSFLYLSSRFGAPYLVAVTDRFLPLHHPYLLSVRSCREYPRGQGSFRSVVAFEDPPPRRHCQVMR